MKEKVVIIGAGSASFTRGLLVDLMRRGEEMELALVDTDPEAAQVAEGLANRMIEARKVPIKVTASTDRRDVLRGATVVVCTIGVGGRRAWERDVFIPRKYGVFQPVGDSVMPGGTSRALRMIPAMVEIATDVLDLAPDALFFNHANPMSPVCRAVRKATGAEMVGLCIGVFDVAQYLAEHLGVPPGRVRYTAAGMNHLTWFTEVRVDGQDAMPRLQHLGAERLAEYLDGDGRPSARARAECESIGTLNLFSWQLCALFGAFPAPLDRHVTEFFPQLYTGQGSYFGETLGLEAYSFERVIEMGDNCYDEMREIACSKRPLSEGHLDHSSGEHQQVVDIIDSIRTDAGRLYSVNLPNQGQVPNLPDDVILECRAVADGSGLRPIIQRPLSPALAGTLATRFAWVETVVEAALQGSREKFVQALVVDGSVRSLAQAVELADELLAAQAEYLPKFASVQREKQGRVGEAADGESGHSARTILKEVRTGV